MSALSLCFFFNDPPTPETYTLSLHDALPISDRLAGRDALAARDLVPLRVAQEEPVARRPEPLPDRLGSDRKSTRLNSSHRCISYAVFCLKKKKKKNTTTSIKYTICAIYYVHV